MLNTVRPDLIFLAEPGTVLRRGMEYEANANRQGAISGICENGALLGVRSGDFVFLDAPGWVLKIWSEIYPEAVAPLSSKGSEGK